MSSSSAERTLFVRMSPAAPRLKNLRPQRVMLAAVGNSARGRGGLVPVVTFTRRRAPRGWATIPRCALIGSSFKGCGCGFDPLFEFVHQPAPRPARRDRIEKFEGDAAGPLPETAPAPKQAGIDRRRNQRQGQCLVQSIDAGLVGRRHSRRRRASLADKSRLGVALLRPGAPRRASAAMLQLLPCGRLRWRRRAPCTSHKTGRPAAPF